MNSLAIFYDEKCGLCSRFKAWLTNEPTYIELYFYPYDSAEAQQAFPEIERYEPEKELLVLADNGDLYRGADAWIMCLWATREYRLQSARLAQPAIKPLIKRICGVVSSDRHSLSTLLRLRADADLVREIDRFDEDVTNRCDLTQTT